MATEETIWYSKLSFLHLFTFNISTQNLYLTSSEIKNKHYFYLRSYFIIRLCHMSFLYRPQDIYTLKHIYKIVHSNSKQSHSSNHHKTASLSDSRWQNRSPNNGYMIDKAKRDGVSVYVCLCVCCLYAGLEWECVYDVSWLICSRIWKLTCVMTLWHLFVYLFATHVWIHLS